MHFSSLYFFEGIFTGTDIRKILADAEFYAGLLPVEQVAWDAFRTVVRECLGVQRCYDFRENIERMLISFNEINVRMNLKIHFLHFHMDQFAAQLSTESDEHGEKFHQIAAPMEHFFKGKPLDHLLAEMCWHMMEELEEF